MNRKKKPFRFKQFEIHHDQCAMKVGTDGVLLGAWADSDNHSHILDLGTGSGLIAIMQAQKNTNARIVGLEIDEASASQAKYNIGISPWKDRLEIVHIDANTFESEILFDHIITNPPFFEVATHALGKERQNARQQSSLTFEDIIQFVRKWLRSKGKFSIILPTNEARLFMEMALGNNLFPSRILEVFPKKEKPVERWVMEFILEEKRTCLKESLIIQHEKRNDWTVEYIQLTKAFYLKM